VCLCEKVCGCGCGCLCVCVYERGHKSACFMFCPPPKSRATRDVLVCIHVLCGTHKDEVAVIRALPEVANS